ncbi:MAG: PRC-barrel domain-containing protein [Chloroflexota bacterium]
MSEGTARVGLPVVGRRGKRIGRVEAVFADYLLARTGGLMPVDLYLPVEAVEVADDRVTVDASAAEAYERWHRPLRRVAHD